MILVAIVLALFSVYQLSFTVVTSIVEKRAEEYSSIGSDSLAKVLASNGENSYDYYFDSIKAERERFYYDSIGTIYMWQNYRKCKEQELNLGLDLKGGMNVIMEVSVPDIIYGLSNHKEKDSDDDFTKAMNEAIVEHQNSQADFVDIFVEKYRKISGGAKLAPIFKYAEGMDIKDDTSDDDVISKIKKETSDAIDRTYKILRTRIDRFGVAQPNIQKMETSGRILVELPGIKDPERIKKLLRETAQLEFWETFNFAPTGNENGGFYNYLASANAYLASIDAVTGEKKDGNDSIDQQENPLYKYLIPAVDGNGSPIPSACIGYAKSVDTANVMRLIKLARNEFPVNAKFAWSNKPREFGNNVYLYELIALRATKDNKCSLSGEYITNARQDYDQFGQVEVTMEMNREGANKWQVLTGSNVGSQIAIVLDNLVYSYPNVNGEISGGRSSISGGSMTVEEAQDLANILKAGKLPAAAKILEENVVGPSLGQEAITSGLWSFIIAFALVLIYMIFFYSKAGIAADIALLVNILFFFGVIASFGTVLTLPGIAGIVLTLGMAVDSNVIIFERIKEEIKAGKGIRLAVADGFKAAYSAILDGQITTFLTGFILFEFGTGPVQGFATTLMIGICTSLFTSIFITRLILENWLDKGKDISFSTNLTRNFLKNTKFDFIKFGKTAFIIGGIMIIISFGSLAIRGLNLGIDFQGGRNYVVRFDKDVTDNEVREALAKVEQFSSEVPEVKTYGPNRQVKITTKYKIKEDNQEIDEEIQQLLYTGLKDFYTDGISMTSFATSSEKNEAKLGIMSSQKVGPTIADDVKNKAIIAVVISLVVIFAYIAIRFKKWQYGVSSIIALAHDTIIVIGVYSLLYNILPFSMEVDQSFIAAVLTIIGYSINNTVVIFDRVRENVTLYPKRSWYDRINDGVNSTLLRSVNTSGSTLVVLLAIFIFGGETIRGFVFALLVGIIAGTFSSLFIASPISYILFRGKKTDAKLEAANDSKKK